MWKFVECFEASSSAMNYVCRCIHQDVEIVRDCRCNICFRWMELIDRIHHMAMQERVCGNSISSRHSHIAHRHRRRRRRRHHHHHHHRRRRRRRRRRRHHHHHHRHHRHHHHHHSYCFFPNRGLKRFFSHQYYIPVVINLQVTSWK